MNVWATLYPNTVSLNTSSDNHTDLDHRGIIADQKLYFIPNLKPYEASRGFGVLGFWG